MGIDYFLLSDLNLRSFKLSHDAPHRFVEPSIGRSVPLWYVLYRCVAAVYLSTSLVGSLCLYLVKTRDARYLLHFPIWGYSIMTLYSILLAIQVYVSYRTIRMSSKVAPATQHRKTAGFKRRRRKKTKTSFEARPSLSLVFKVIWITHYISLYSGLMTLVMYAVKLFKGVIRNSWLSPPVFTVEEVVIHIVFGPLSFIDFWMSGITIRLLHVYVMPCYSILYHLVVLCYTFLSSQYSPPLYDAADYRSHERVIISVLYFLGFALITPVAVHFMYYVLHIVKLYLADLVMYRLQPILDAGQQTDAAQEAVPVAVDMNAADAAAATSAEKEGVVGLRATIPPISETEETEIIVDPIIYT